MVPVVMVNEENLQPSCTFAHAMMVSRSVPARSEQGWNPVRWISLCLSGLTRFLFLLG